ncbi:ABC transporter permease [Actinocatenispora rupis]|uniref:ABC transporter permease n=1 Tax=Actinocatenispora rupis TaxID=519421 RepID=A0A8J3N8A6_9ACTN|nr:ABC-2 family transporter protein [Actinocatenispora rupis]GID09876.1 ABC transporter permease [Actinocatenispora rupis]
MRRYLALARMQARVVLAYRIDYLNGLIGLLLQVFLLAVVWRTVYGERDSVDGVPLATMLAYVTLASVQGWLFNPWVFTLIPDRVREGRVGIDLVRPVGFVSQVVAAQVGRTAATAPFALAALPFAVLLSGMAPPASPLAAVGYLVSLALGYAVTTVLSVVFGLMTFWTMEIGGIFIIYRMVAQFLSGALIPLWFMPGALRTVAQVLPFQAVTYTPTAIYLGRLDAGAAVLATGVQCGWVLVLALLARLVWSRALHRVVVQGG